MSKYTYQFKRNLIHDYLENDLTTEEICEKYKIKNKSTIWKWVKLFQEFGDQGLKAAKNHKEYDLDFKLKLVELYTSGNSTYKQLAKEYNIPDPTLIGQWVRILKNNGYEGLKPKQNGRKSTLKPEVNKILKKHNKSKHKTQQKITPQNVWEQSCKKLENENKKLKDQVENYQIEVAYLKELWRLWKEGKI